MDLFEKMYVGKPLPTTLRGNYLWVLLLAMDSKPRRKTEGCVKTKIVGEEWLEENRFESCFGDGQVWIGLHVFVWISTKAKPETKPWCI